MMRCLTTEQKNLYQQYSKLGKKLVNDLKFENDLINGSICENVWKFLSKEGIWSLPIAKEYGGQGLTWQDCLVALDGFFSQYPNTKLLTKLISQISSLYLISQYGTKSTKEHHLPCLINGEMTRLVISKEIHPLLPRNIYSYIKKNKISYLRNNKIRIYVRKINDDIIFFINEIKLNLPKKATYKPDLSVTKSIGLSALCDLINFERLFYGILSANFAGRIFSKLKMNITSSAKA